MTYSLRRYRNILKNLGFCLVGNRGLSIILNIHVVRAFYFTLLQFEFSCLALDNIHRPTTSYDTRLQPSACPFVFQMLLDGVPTLRSATWWTLFSIKVFYHVSQEIYISAAINFVIRLPSSAIHNYLSDNSSFLSSRPCCRAFLVALPGEQPLQNYLYQHL